MRETRICAYTLKKNQRTPNDQRSDSMNPNNPRSREYMASLRRLIERTDEIEQRFRVFDRMSDQSDQLQRQFDRIESSFSRKRTALRYRESGMHHILFE